MPSRVGPVAVIAHGSGSDGDFVRRAFGPPLAAYGWTLVTLEDRSGDVEEVGEALREAADRLGAGVVGGVSLGAHAAARAAAGRTDLAGVLLALPAWTGAPGAVAALSAVAAGELEREGLPRALDRLQGGGWVAEELARTWPAYGEGQLVQALRATARGRGPTLAELAAVTAPVGLVAVANDPFHPASVARLWAATLPSAALRVLAPDAPGVAADGVAVLGAAALEAWGEAREKPTLGPRGASGSR